MRRALLTTALLASHGVALWLGRQSPVLESSSASSPQAPVPSKPAGPSLASFLRGVEPREEAQTEDESDAGEDEDSRLAAARAAIGQDADPAALARSTAADPDLPLSIETRAAFGVWLDRDPLAAMRWALDWALDSSSSDDLMEEFSRHFREGGTAQLGLYLRELPAARSFLFEQAAYVANDREPAFALQLAASLGSYEDRLELLANRFGSDAHFKDHLASIRQLLDDSTAAAFLSKIGRVPLTGEHVEALAQAGFPPYAVAQFAANFSGLQGQWRTNADFIGAIEQARLPGVPDASATNVTNLGSAGSGAINRNNIDAMLNNPNRAADIPMADRIRGYFSGGASVDSLFWAWFSASDLESIKGYAESSDQFMRGKISGEEFTTAVEQAVPGGAELQDEIAAFVFRASLGEDPRRALSLLSPSFPHQELLLGSIVSPEVALQMAQRLTGDGEPSLEVTTFLGKHFSTWFEEDRRSCAAYLAQMPAGPMKGILEPWMEAPPEYSGEEGP